MLSDALAGAQVIDPLRIALICLAPVAVLAALAYLAVSRVVARDSADVLRETAQ
jgi:hypothetical protein